MNEKFPQSRVAQPGPHAHHMIIETPNGPTSRGRCKSCGYTHDYTNWFEDALTKELRIGNKRNNNKRLNLRKIKPND